MHITRDRVARTISIDKTQYLTDVLDKHSMSDCAPYLLPMDSGFLSSIASSTLTPLTCPARDVYPSLLGSLKYAAICSRLDISTALSILGSAQANPSVQHFQAIKKVLRYLKGTISMCLTLGGGDDHSKHLSGYADVDCLGQRCNTTEIKVWVHDFSRQRGYQLPQPPTVMCGTLYLRS
jgi:hypothetical protein